MIVFPFGKMGDCLELEISEVCDSVQKMEKVTAIDVNKILTSSSETAQQLPISQESFHAVITGILRNRFHVRPKNQIANDFVALDIRDSVRGTFGNGEGHSHLLMPPL
jgi:hypothetical protein